MSASEWLVAAGRFHPVVLHLPIGLMVGVAGLEVWSALRGQPALRPALRVLLWWASLSAIGAAGCGWLLADAGGYDPTLLYRHRVAGLAVAVLVTATLVLERRRSPATPDSGASAYRAALAASMGAIFLAGHFGGSITHGADHPLLALTALFESDRAGPALEVGRDGSLFRREVAPILEQRCQECHGAEKQKSGLRLDSRAAALAGGESGEPAVVPGDAVGSRLVRAITLPREHDQAMPPTGKRSLTPNEVWVLIDWINRGADWLDPTEALAEGLPAPSEEVIANLRQREFHLEALSRGSVLLRVDRVPTGARLSELAPLALHITWLDLSGHTFETGELELLAGMQRLTRLALQRSNVSDADLAALGRLAHLRALDLYGTDITDAGLEPLRQLEQLEQLYLWQTGTSEAGAERLRAALPELRVDRGIEAAGTATTL